MPDCRADVQTSATREHLRAHLDSLVLQMRSESPPHFREALDAPNYSAMRESGLDDRHNGFGISNICAGAFIHASREPGQCAGGFDGDKFHISVARETVPQAFDALSGLLFSEDSPIEKWKVTDIERALSERVIEGCQLTLYVKSDTADSHYTALGLHRIRHFVERLESALTDHGIQPGKHPESDVRPDHWQYTSYRNENRSGREGSEAQSRALRSEPFYQLVTA